MITRQIQAKLVDTELKYIAHGLSCQRRYVSEASKSLFEAYPQVKGNYYHATRNVDESLALGRMHAVAVPPNRYAIYAMLTQLKNGGAAERELNSAAIVACFEELVNSKPVGPVAISKGGWGVPWEIAQNLIEQTVGEKIEIWVYE